MARTQRTIAAGLSSRMNRYSWTHESARNDIQGGGSWEMVGSASDDYKTEEVYKFSDRVDAEVNYRSERRYGFDKPEQNGIFEIVDAATVKVST